MKTAKDLVVGDTLYSVDLSGFGDRTIKEVIITEVVVNWHPNSKRRQFILRNENNLVDAAIFESVDGNGGYDVYNKSIKYFTRPEEARDAIKYHDEENLFTSAQQFIEKYDAFAKHHSAVNPQLENAINALRIFFSNP